MRTTVAYGVKGGVKGVKVFEDEGLAATWACEYAREMGGSIKPRGQFKVTRRMMTITWQSETHMLAIAGNRDDLKPKSPPRARADRVAMPTEGYVTLLWWAPEADKTSIGFESERAAAIWAQRFIKQQGVAKPVSELMAWPGLQIRWEKDGLGLVIQGASGYLPRRISGYRLWGNATKALHNLLTKHEAASEYPRIVQWIESRTPRMLIHRQASKLERMCRKSVRAGALGRINFHVEKVGETVTLMYQLWMRPCKSGVYAPVTETWPVCQLTTKQP